LFLRFTSLFNTTILIKRNSIILCFGLVFSSPIFAQLKLNSAGKVGIGGVEPVATLHVKDPTTAALWLQNGNGYKWGISNHMTGVYGAPNSLAICREYNGRAEDPVMEFRQDRTYIHYRTYLGGGNAMDYPVLELEKNQWMAVRAGNSGANATAGILFIEDHSSSNVKRDRSYLGARLFYDGQNDRLVLGTLNMGEAIDRVYLSRYGNLSIGGLPVSSYKLAVYGNALISGGTWIDSDARYKSDITALGTETAKLNQLRGVSYHKEVPSQSDSISAPDSDPAEAKLMHAAKEKKSKSREYGFLAQEVQQLYPDLVLADDDGYLSVNYNGFIPLLVESVKEQQAAIEALEAEKKVANTEAANLAKELLKLKIEVDKLKKSCCKDNSSSLKSGVVGSSTSTVEEDTEFVASLFQNIPNPFSETTQIQYYLPQVFGSAAIYLYDMTGTQLDAFPLSGSGYGSITINGGQLHAGLYLYGLVVDGALVETKQMVLTK